MIDRVKQLEYLKRLAAEYPAQVDVQRWDEPKARSANLWYLAQHDLIDIQPSQEMQSPWNVILAKINARGLDFLADDGGLSAVLGVVTVKLHADTIRDLIAEKLAASDMPAEQKSTLLNRLRSLGGEALKELTKELVKRGIDASPAGYDWLRATVDGLARVAG